MKVSIITVVYNAEATIEQAIQSVLAQTHAPIEYIIVDGASIDGTPDIIKRYTSKIAQWIREPDDGIYDAINKGIAVATGEVVGILNADDFYSDSNVIADVIAAFQDNPTVGCVYGDIVYLSQKDSTTAVRYWTSGVYTRSAFKRGWHPPTPATFVRRDLFAQYGNFDTALPIAADYDIFLRFLYVHHVEAFHVARVLTYMRTGGASSGIRAILDGNRECRSSWQKNGITPPKLLVLRKLWSKLKQTTIRLRILKR